MTFAPFGHYLSHSGLEFIVNFTLSGGHRHEQILLSPLRKLKFYIRLPAPYQSLCEPLAHKIQILVGQYLAAFVLHSSLVNELVIRPQTILVHELHHRVKLHKLVFQRSSGQHYGIVRFYLARRPRNLRVPVFQSLHLIHDQTFRISIAEGADIIAHRIVRDNPVERLAPIQFPALVLRPFDDYRHRIRELLDFLFPLVFQ